MKTKFLFILAAASLLLTGACSSSDDESGNGSQTGGGGGTQETPDYIELKFMSFNIRLNSSSDGSNAWDYRQEAAVKMIQDQKPVCIGMQEVQPGQNSYLKSKLTEYGVYGLGRNSASAPEDSSSTDECMMVYWLKSEVDLVSYGTFWLSETPDVKSYGWDATIRRTCTWCMFRHKATKQLFYFFNTHFDHKGETARTESVKLIVKKIKEINFGDNRPVVLVADFNSNTSHERFVPLHEYMKDARTNAAITDDHYTYNGWGKSSSTIDHLFYRGEGCEALEYHTVTENYGVPYVSDHYPVTLRLKIPVKK